MTRDDWKIHSEVTAEFTADPQSEIGQQIVGSVIWSELIEDGFSADEVLSIAIGGPRPTDQNGERPHGLRVSP